MSSKIVLCYGELLIDMISTTVGNLNDSEGFLKKFGGAPGNTAVGLSKLNVPVYFMGKVGNDPFGRFLKKELDSNGVNTSLMLLSSEYRTTLAFVALSKGGERDFTFYPGAHDKLMPDEIKVPGNTAIVHFGSLTQTNPQAREATQKFIDEAGSKGAILSYDPNVREALWEDHEEMKRTILETAKKVDIMKVNEEEALFLSGEESVDKASKKLFTDNLDALLITRGGEGAYFRTAKYKGTVSGLKVNAIDTTGAGDAFNAGFLSALYESDKRFSEMTEEELIKIFSRACAIASLTTTKKGAISAFPTKEEIAKVV